MTSDMLINSRNLRKNQTLAEMHLWRHLKDRRFFGLKFKRQFIIKPYIVDFICLKHKLIIEVDGSQHLDNQKYDIKRTKYLETLQFKVVRFWNNEVLANTQAVLDSIYISLLK